MNSQRPRSVSRRKELQGSRPSALKIRRDSQKVRNPRVAVPAIPPTPLSSRSQPVIVYLQSPRIIHAQVQDFMSLVQRLTGKSSSSDTLSDSIETENLTSGTHDSTIHQASTATTSYQPVSSLANVGMCSDNESTSHYFVNPNSPWATMIDMGQEIASSTSEHGFSAATFASTVQTTPFFSLLSPNTIFQHLPHVIPNSDYLFYSPRNFHRSSEPFLSAHRPRMNSWSMISSKSLTALDLYNTSP